MSQMSKSLPDVTRRVQAGQKSKISQVEIFNRTALSNIPVEWPRLVLDTFDLQTLDLRPFPKEII
jgi:hypothetical protein